MFHLRQETKGASLLVNHSNAVVKVLCTRQTLPRCLFGLLCDDDWTRRRWKSTVLSTELYNHKLSRTLCQYHIVGWILNILSFLKNIFFSSPLFFQCHVRRRRGDRWAHLHPHPHWLDPRNQSHKVRPLSVPCTLLLRIVFQSFMLWVYNLTSLWADRRPRMTAPPDLTALSLDMYMYLVAEKADKPKHPFQSQNVLCNILSGPQTWVKSGISYKRPLPYLHTQLRGFRTPSLNL